MASCETNGFINHVSTIVTGSTVIPVSNSYTPTVGEEHSRDLRSTPALMPPRTDCILNCSIPFGEASVDCQPQSAPVKLLPSQNQTSLLDINHSQSDVPTFCHREDRLQSEPTLTPSKSCKLTPLRLSLQSPSSRFRAYKQRLNQCSTRLSTVRARCSTILVHLLSTQNSSSSRQSARFDEVGDETESSTDDEVLADEEPNMVTSSTNDTMSSTEETWLCTRAISSSNWFWFLSELQRCKRHISRLSAIKSRIRSSRLSARPIVPGDSCSRATPWVCGGSTGLRHTQYDLATIKSAVQLSTQSSNSSSDMPSLGIPTVTSARTDGQGSDEVTHCSCIMPYSGPCINCFDRTSELQSEPAVTGPHTVDLISAARPLGAHIHPKLSLPRDIQLSLRLESRLAAFSPVTFREHKTTIHPVRYSPLQPRSSALFKQLSDHARKVNSLLPSTSAAIKTKEDGEGNSGETRDP